MLAVSCINQHGVGGVLKIGIAVVDQDVTSTVCAAACSLPLAPHAGRQLGMSLVLGGGPPQPVREELMAVPNPIQPALGELASDSGAWVAASAVAPAQAELEQLFACQCFQL